MIFCRLLIFFKNQIKKENSRIYQSVKQFGTQIRPDVSIWPDLGPQTVCKSYQQTTLVGKYFVSTLQVRGKLLKDAHADDSKKKK